ncbi:DUF2975 domain-containing protein [Aurantiacibacter rhizosphaerae]|uniref:DUF2975 domain-containing protein n=1 Tax=Aurantiacibacter rhizosphaerae TaxID=2691582 RepID=A0A844XGJ7_9SPHN|nr:DUF2975 domain-containing protein [Aurantiacibacter rhizosphaerae]MWV28843.1 DUF2975 domain-containing protein [Aurantiacibacter rhizosphaerae]
MNHDTRPNDLLLLAGKVLCVIMQAIMAIGAVALIVAAAALLIWQGTIIAEYAAEIGDPDAVFPVYTLLGVMLIGLAIVAMLFLFFGILRKIIRTVGDRDPFAPANADRLSRMGWLMLGVQLAMIPAVALGVHLAQFADELEDVNVTVDGGTDVTGILLVIILFILARVFRHGAAMREDLEGTV